MRRLVSAFAFALLVLATLPARASGGLTVRVLVPDRGNLQYASFWLALGADYFADEGYDIELVVPPAPQLVQQFYEERRADVAVLPPPVYVNLVGARSDVVLIANLLANDPIELIVRRSVLDAKHTRPTDSLREKLDAIRGVKIGIAPHPMPRLRVLYSSVMLDADRDATTVIIPGKDQNAAFHNGEVDALYAHTPFLEKAIVQDDAVVLVDQSRGDVPGLANRQIHALVVRQGIIDAQRPLAVGLVRALLRAEHLIHASPAEAVAVFARMFPERDRRELETIVRLYAPAIPRLPIVSGGQIPNAALLYPEGQKAPDFIGVDFAHYAAPDILTSAMEEHSLAHSHRVMVYAALVVVGMIALGFVTARIGRRR